MKIVGRDSLIRNGSGRVEMVPEEADDFWVAYNLIAKGDTISTSVTVKKPVKKTTSRDRDHKLAIMWVKSTLEIKVESMEYETQGFALRVRGKMINNNVDAENEQYVEKGVGVFHTIVIEPGLAFVLKKKAWDSLALESLHQASSDSPPRATDLVVVLMNYSVAQIFFVGKSVTVSRCRIEQKDEHHTFRDRSDADRFMKKFIYNVLQALLRHVDFKVVRRVVIACPAYSKGWLHDQMLLEAKRNKLSAITENKARIVLVHTNAQSLKAVFDAPDFMNRIKDTRISEEVRALNEFSSMLLNKDPARACYGPNNVEVAHANGAVQTLLISDELYRNSVIGKKKKYADLVKSVKDSGGTVYIFSSMHVSGEGLAKYSNIAAILRFPLAGTRKH
ncbi:OLC1v1035540C1 [Oldenlandia corymbosa var. corymbosa]|uniref:OLC1v1035540C1 n=1 Tax=Oldenlandia corymbosa var. corymbosa TaxID=529605 RepID=A0AAV1CT76_OLDCO|nr:OLC1v1035540C1 [Oldenlandia corymbosa var. corymbosa]